MAYGSTNSNTSLPLLGSETAGTEGIGATLLDSKDATYAIGFHLKCILSDFYACLRTVRDYTTNYEEGAFIQELVASSVRNASQRVKCSRIIKCSAGSGTTRRSLDEMSGQVEV